MGNRIEQAEVDTCQENAASGVDLKGTPTMEARTQAEQRENRDRFGVPVGSEFGRVYATTTLFDHGKLHAILPDGMDRFSRQPMFVYSNVERSVPLQFARRTERAAIALQEKSIASVVRVKLDSRANKSNEKILKAILYRYDSLLGTKYMAQLPEKASIADYVQKVVRVARIHHTEVIVMDEIQKPISVGEKFKKGI
ncbi:hypothetical protein [Paraburkholderia hospita]|uniref:hypothetical protein n=1 Tax=Paraburkholderia hospita TaxID=169430 RepID=UPI0009A69819|nr:hypothetical protein [Paraburkholderia hospita]SKC69865.1 hypothetical protein SAMN05446934_2015 [Paraburkholderia hospita]